jgi:putative sigma-54 modulation protein
MNIKISYRHMTSTEAIDETTRKKSEKLKKYFNGKLKLDWNFSVEKQEHVSHCHLTGDHIEFFAEAKTDSIYKGIDEVVAHLEKQVRKNKEKLKDHHAQAHEVEKLTSDVLTTSANEST